MTVEKALDDYEDAAHMLWFMACCAPMPLPRPPWWKPYARWRHLVEHGEALARWAEGVEEWAQAYSDARADLDVARRRADLHDALRRP